MAELPIKMYERATSSTIYGSSGHIRTDYDWSAASFPNDSDWPPIGDFTWEFYIYNTHLAGLDFWGQYIGEANQPNQINVFGYYGISGFTKLRYYFNGTTTDEVFRSFYFDGATTIEVNKWYHVALTRQYDDATHSYFKIWLNGQLDATSTNFYYIFKDTGLTPRIGSFSQATYYYMLGFKGYMDELRWSNICRYTTDFTPPDPFTADDNTIMLLKFTGSENSTDIIDSSNNPKIITNPAPSATNPIYIESFSYTTPIPLKFYERVGAVQMYERS